MSDSSIERATARMKAAEPDKKDRSRELNSVAPNEPTDIANALTLKLDGLPDVDGAEDSVKREVYEEFRVLKRALLGSTYESSNASPENLIMVTSITGKAGKTFASLMLARSLSMEPNKHALIVDADVFLFLECSRGFLAMCLTYLTKPTRALSMRLFQTPI